MRALFALAAAVVLAGCGEAIFGMCGPQDTVEWHDRALYDALGGPTDASDQGIADASALGLPGARVTTLQWAPQGERHNEREMVRASLDAANVWVEATSDEEARAMLRSFLANLSAADEATRDEMLEAALANKTVAMQSFREGEPVTVLWRYATDARGGWRVEELAQELGPSARTAFSSTGTARIEAGAYAFIVDVPVRTADLDGIELSVDATGNARAYVGTRAEGATQEESVERVREALRARNLPQPPQEPQVSTAIC